MQLPASRQGPNLLRYSHPPRKDAMDRIPEPELMDEDEQARILRADCGPIRVCNVYVPNGESVESEKYPYKLGWLARLRAMFDAPSDRSKRRSKLRSAASSQRPGLWQWAQLMSR